MSLSATAIVGDWAEKYNLPPVHCSMVLKDVQEVLGGGNSLTHAESVREIEDLIKSCPYRLHAMLGRGTFGAVYRAVDTRKNVTVAMKIIDLEESKDDMIVTGREIQLLADAHQCSQLTRYYESMVLGTKLWIAMEFMTGGSLWDYIHKYGALSEAHIAIVLRESLLGLRFLNQNNRIHRDVKAANILLSRDGNVKLGDFGTTREMSADTMNYTLCGSPFWIAPEVMSGDKYDGKADVWSLGITCFEMATTVTPYHNVPPVRLPLHIPRAPEPRLEVPRFSEHFADFVAKCVVKDPAERASVDALLKHPFILGAGPITDLVHLWPSGNASETIATATASEADAALVATARAQK